MFVCLFVSPIDPFLLGTYKYTQFRQKTNLMRENSPLFTPPPSPFSHSSSSSSSSSASNQGGSGINNSGGSTGSVTDDKEGVLPLVIVLCIEYLRERLDLEGVFRISGEVRKVVELKERFLEVLKEDQGRDNFYESVLDLDKVNTGIWGNYLMMYFQIFGILTNSILSL